ncbi:unnamed protein product [Prorocentrum cordatum]|uniref:Uncharacterized protein n=1 Tax=Prorocentrum cordatum TaxID=2364126 RepID=A0ABN9WKH1_9DINO|nr:unnamed protein product [Polarella glacialis]
MVGTWSLCMTSIMQSLRVPFHLMRFSMRGVGRRLVMELGTCFALSGLRHPCGNTQCQAYHYDCFAFRDEHFDSFNAARDGGVAANSFAQYDLDPVHSCFGGLAVYKTQKLLGCRYSASEYDSEHVGLNSCMRGQGSHCRLYLDPLLTLIADPITPLICHPNAAVL